MQDGKAEKPLTPPITINQPETVPALENTKKLEKIFNQLNPEFVLNFLQENPDILGQIKGLKNGEKLAVNLDSKIKYAMDAISFRDLMDNQNITWPPEAKDELQKSLLQEFMKLGNWVSQRDAQERYVLLRIDTAGKPMPSDEEQSTRYTKFLTETAPKIIEDLRTKHPQLAALEVSDCLFIARGQTIDPATRPELRGQLVFIKDARGKVVAAQNMPAGSDLIFAPIVASKSADIQKLQTGQNTLPLVVPGQEHILNIPSKKTLVGIDFVSGNNPYPQNEEGRTETVALDEELSSWVYHNLRCEGYFTPEEFYNLLKITHPEIDFEGYNHEILDVLIEHAIFLNTARHSIELDAQNIATDISGMSLISRRIDELPELESKRMIQKGFTAFLNRWQAKVVGLQSEQGLLPDEIAGDGVKAYDIRQEGDQLPLAKQLELAFAVQGSWQSLINEFKNMQPDVYGDQPELAEIQAFIEFISTDDFPKIVNKTSLARSATFARWYAQYVDVIPKDKIKTDTLLVEVKDYLLEPESEQSVIIIPQELYVINQHEIDQFCEVVKNTSSGVIIARKNSRVEIQVNPREVLTSILSP